MPRSKRIEYAGAVYHVINRGNYQQDLFSSNEWKNAEVFDKVLKEACSRYGWTIYAYVIMSNHYHLCIKTSQANLSIGMQWLQSVFANRFNRFIQTPGHVFQGRYKALLVETGEKLVPLINYIHLNPVRAGLFTVVNLDRHRWGSFPAFLKKEKLPELLDRDTWLSIGGFGMGRTAMQQYRRYLKLREEAEPAMESELQKTYCRGWCIGSKSFKKSVLKDIEVDRVVEKPGQYNRTMLEDIWDSELERCLELLNKNAQNIEQEPKNARWKRMIGYRLKNKYGAGNRYLSDRLNMGSLPYVSVQVSELEVKNLKRDKEWKLLEYKQ